MLILNTSCCQQSLLPSTFLKMEYYLEIFLSSNTSLCAHDLDNTILDSVRNLKGRKYGL